MMVLQILNLHLLKRQISELNKTNLSGENKRLYAAHQVDKYDENREILNPGPFHHLENEL
jgi:hypothetical protein